MRKVLLDVLAPGSRSTPILNNVFLAREGEDGEDVFKRINNEYWFGKWKLVGWRWKDEATENLRAENLRPPLDWNKPTPFNQFKDLEGWTMKGGRLIMEENGDGDDLTWREEL